MAAQPHSTQTPDFILVRERPLPRRRCRRRPRAPRIRRRFPYNARCAAASPAASRPSSCPASSTDPAPAPIRNCEPQSRRAPPASCRCGSFLSATTCSPAAPSGCTASTCSAAIVSVSGSVAESPADASCTVTATMAPGFRSTPCSALWAKCVRPSFIFAIFASRILRRLPRLVRRRPFLPGPVEAGQLRSRRRLNPRCLRQPPHERLVRFPGVPPFDAPHRRVRFQRRRIDADRLSLHQTRFGQPLQNPGEHRHVGLDVDPPPRARQRRVVRRRLRHVQIQKRPQTQRIGHPPRNPPLGRQLLEIADEQQPEIPAWPQTRAAQPVRVEGRAQPFDEGVESGLRQDSVQPLEERMAAARREVFRVHPHRRRLPRRRFLTHRHARSVYGTPIATVDSDPLRPPTFATGN